MDYTLTQLLQELVRSHAELDRLRPELENLRKRVSELEETPRNGTSMPVLHGVTNTPSIIE